MKDQGGQLSMTVYRVFWGSTGEDGRFSLSHGSVGSNEADSLQDQHHCDQSQKRRQDNKLGVSTHADAVAHETQS